MLRVLGVSLGPADLRRRAAWLAPDAQPFFVDGDAAPVAGALPQRDLTPELADTFAAWRLEGSLRCVWLDEPSFMALPRPDRSTLVRAQVGAGRGAVPTVRAWSDLVDPTLLRGQADGHRFVWWPSLVATDFAAITSRAIARTATGRERELLPSRHEEVPATTWRNSAPVLPRARTLAGTFPAGSGPNCFSTVMSAADAPGADDARGSVGPFEQWLASACRRGGADDEPGTVLVWRNRSGAAVHAALTVGDGWVLEKSSSEWWTPRAIVAASDAIRGNRARGLRVERHRITSQ